MCGRGGVPLRLAGVSVIGPGWPSLRIPKPTPLDGEDIVKHD
jgi:hypothetical protein